MKRYPYCEACSLQIQAPGKRVHVYEVIDEIVRE